MPDRVRERHAVPRCPSPDDSLLTCRAATVHPNPNLSPKLPRTPALGVDPTDVLISILADYPGGQILNEGLQNADDAGGTKFCLLLDKRRHPCDAVRGFREELADGDVRSSVAGISTPRNPSCA